MDDFNSVKVESKKLKEKPNQNKNIPFQTFSSHEKKPQNEPTPIKNVPYPTFSSNQFKVFPHNPTKYETSTTPILHPRPTFAPMFSITPFVASFSQLAGGGGGDGQNRREYKATTKPAARTTQKMDLDIFREFFPEIELKKILVGKTSKDSNE